MKIHKIKGGPLHSPYPIKEKGLDKTSYHSVGSGFGFDSS